MGKHRIDMPVLKDFRATKIITLPSFPDSKVEIFDSLLIGQMVTVNQGEKNMMLFTVDVLPKFIKSWNFTDEAGKELAITTENLGFLKEDDAKYLIEQITEFGKEVKKKINPSQ